MKLEQIEYGGWSDCTRLSNGSLELVVTAAVGPRIIRCGFVGGENLFCEMVETLGLRGGDSWRSYGGHRLWHAPEVPERTYYADNHPVALSAHAGGLRVIQPMEPTTGIQKELDIFLDDAVDHVRVVHRLRNHNLWAVTLAPWALSVMAAGTRGIVPLPPKRSHAEQLHPSNSLTLWAYTDMSDPRWTWGAQYILLQQDATSSTPQKLGVDVRDGWAAATRDNLCFIKLFERVPDAAYPDMNASVEIFTDNLMLELETLGPLTVLQPGVEVEYVEDWFVFADVPTPQNDVDVEQYVLPKVRQAQQLSR